jgi:hypothetical protein
MKTRLYGDSSRDGSAVTIGLGTIREVLYKRTKTTVATETTLCLLQTKRLHLAQNPGAPDKSESAGLPALTVWHVAMTSSAVAWHSELVDQAYQLTGRQLSGCACRQLG